MEQQKRGRHKNALGGMISYSIQIIGLSYILSRLNVVIILYIIAVIIVNTCLNNRIQKKYREIYIQLTPIERMWNYLNRISEDYSLGKIIRINNISKFILEKCKANRKIYVDKQAQFQKSNFQYSTVVSLMSVFQEGLIYVFLISSVVSNKITLGDFTMYLAAAMSYTNAVSNLINFTIGLNYTSKYVNDYIDFLNIKDSIDKTGIRKIPDRQNLCIRFENVYFKYPNSDNYVLKNINTTIRSNERISLVGDNGAGKTTFVKLLMRLYEPTLGKIYLNDVDIREYDYQDYISLFPAVFQDYQNFAFTIAENVAFEDAYNPSNISKIENSLEKCGILEKVNTLPHKLYTYLGKGFEEDGVDLSGEENQKLAIARSIYKGGAVSVLDEPTANLSPIAEYELYKQFNDIVLNKTAIYISHRMSSCKFCDHIAVLDKGELIEYGTHKELMSLNGTYAKMFNSQAQYYINI